MATAGTAAMGMVGMADTVMAAGVVIMAAGSTRVADFTVVMAASMGALVPTVVAATDSQACLLDRGGSIR